MPVMTVEFLVTSLVVVATPGTGVLFTLAAGLSRGGRAGVVAAAGCTLGIVPHVVAAGTGVAAVLHTSALAFQALKYAGVGYLLFMAWSTWRDHGALQVDERPDAARRPADVIVSGVLVNLLNPKLTIFFVAFLPQFVDGEGSGVASMLALSGVFMALTFAVFAVYGMLAARVRHHVLGRPGVLTWMRRTFAASFVALGARLALADR